MQTEQEKRLRKRLTKPENQHDAQKQTLKVKYLLKQSEKRRLFMVEIAKKRAEVTRQKIITHIIIESMTKIF